MSEQLQRRYQRLMWAYPREYRQRRGPEILGTLLDMAADGQRRPAPREVVALAVGGARTWLRTDRRRPVGQVWLGGLRLAVLFLMAQATAQVGSQAGLIVSRWNTENWIASTRYGFLVGTLLCVAALLCVAGGRYGLGCMAAVAAMAAVQYAVPPMGFSGPGSLFGPGMDFFWPLCCATVLSLAVALVRPPSGPAWPWLLAIPAALVLLPTQNAIASAVQPFALGATLLVCLVWMVMDARVSIGAAALCLVQILWLVIVVVRYGGPTVLWSWVIGFGVLAVALLSGGLLGLMTRPGPPEPGVTA